MTHRRCEEKDEKEKMADEENDEDEQGDVEEWKGWRMQRRHTEVNIGSVDKVGGCDVGMSRQSGMKFNVAEETVGLSGQGGGGRKSHFHGA